MAAAWTDVYACLPIQMGGAVKKSELVAHVSSGKVGWKKYWEAVLDGEECAGCGEGTAKVSNVGMWLSKDGDAIEFHAADSDTESVVKKAVKPDAFKACLQKWQDLLESDAEEAALGSFDGDDNGAMFLGEKKDFRKYVRREVKMRVNRIKLLRLVEFCIEVCTEFESSTKKPKDSSKEGAMEFMKKKLIEMKEQ